MCNNYASHVPAKQIAEAFIETGFPLRFDGRGGPNLERDEEPLLPQCAGAEHGLDSSLTFRKFALRLLAPHAGESYSDELSQSR